MCLISLGKHAFCYWVACIVIFSILCCRSVSLSLKMTLCLKKRRKMLKVHCWRYFSHNYLTYPYKISVSPSFFTTNHMHSISKIPVTKSSVSVFPEPPGHCSCLHISSCVYRISSRLEPEDSPPLHLPTLTVVGRAAQSSGGSSGAQPALQNSV